MTRVPAYCENCGAIFPAPVGLGAGSKIILKNVVTNCPFCGSLAQLDGEFEGAGNAIRIIRSKNITPQNLKAFAALLRDAYQKKTSVEETKQQAAKIDPALGEAIESISKSKSVWTASLIVLMFALSRCNFDVNVSLDVNRLLNDIINKRPAEITHSIPLPNPDPRADKGK